jgi:NAD(P)-dependent dehydrogenase (short-subunit alcohol dehydrogenase family)
MEQLDGKVAVVTGAASGIGRALAEAFVAEGMLVVAADIEPHESAEPAISPFVADVRDEDSIDALADHAYATFGRVDVLCNNAGVFAGGRLWECPPEDFAWTLDVNLWGILNGIRAFVPRMLAAGTPGHIVNTVSMAGLVTNAMSGPYTISKFAALAATEVLAHDLALAGAPIKVSAVVPGAVATHIGGSRRNGPTALTESASSMDTLLTDFTAGGAPPAEVAALVVDAIKAERFLVPTRPSFDAQVRGRYDALLARELPSMAQFD